MICEVCQQENATVHLTQIISGKMQKIDLCEKCAKEKGVADPAGFSLADMLLGLGAADEIKGGGSRRNWSARSAASPSPISRRPAASAARNATSRFPRDSA